jgi:signal transduction histidine kinase/ActR/RegA family two-component response regulator
MAWSAAQDASGILYFGCDTVVAFDGDRWLPLGMNPTYLVRGLDAGPGGRIWAAGADELGWFEPLGAGGTYHSLRPMIPGGPSQLGEVWRVYAEGPTGALFVAHDRVLRWDGARFESWAYPGMHLLWSTRTPKGVYVHYPPEGLIRFDRAGPRVVAPAAAIGPSEVRWLDDTGDSWVLLTSQGFRRIRAGACEDIDSEAGRFARANIPSAVARLPDGRLAIATLRGGIALADGELRVAQVLDTASGMPANQVYSLFADRDGALWAMGPSSIVRLGVASGSSVAGPKAGYPAGGCVSLAEIGGTVYAAGYGDLFGLVSPERAFSPMGIPSSRYYSVLATQAGLAVADVRGLSVLTRHGLWRVPGIDDAVFLLAPAKASPGSVLASLSDRVLRVDLETGSARTAADSLADYGDSLVEDASGRIWIGTPSRGVLVAESGGHALPAGRIVRGLPATGPALVAPLGPGVAVFARGIGFVVGPGSAAAAISGIPGGSPIAVSNPGPAGEVWAAFEPAAGARSPRLGRVSWAGGSARWEPRSFEGMTEIGSLLALHVSAGPSGPVLWAAGTEALLRAAEAAPGAAAPPRSPLIRAWASPRSPGEAGAIPGTLPYSTHGIHLEFSSLDFGQRDAERFETMLGGAEDAWSAPSASPERDLSGLREGAYDFQARLVRDSGEAGPAAHVRFGIAPPWWRTAAAKVGLILAIVSAAAGILRLRTASLRRRAEALERIVQERTEKLRMADAAKTDFVASMSHEIRNPMGGILSSALELSETPLDPSQRKLVATIRTCGSFLASLVEDVLDFAAIEEGAYKVSLGPFSPAEVMENVVQMLGPRAGSARMEVVVDPALPPTIEGDAARIQQVIVNFAANSLKFGGRLVTLSARRDGAKAVFTVADDGIGIPEDEVKNLFIRFSRLKSARNIAVPGTGLGLAVSRALAERMGGSVGYAKGPRRGSMFFLKVPLEEARPRPSSDVPLLAGGSRALVVEDLDYNARALGLMLGRLGYAAEYASEGEEALRKLASASYDAVFIDCDLPGLSGLQVVRRFRSREEGRRTLIIATTALTTAADRERCLAAGMDGFIAKPITPEKLRQALFSKEPERAQADEPGIRLDLIRHLAGGAPGAVAREIARFSASMAEAMRGFEAAVESGSRRDVSSAAHRVLSLARMVGDDAMAAAASDLQEYASAYSDAELAQEAATLTRHAGDLSCMLTRLADGVALSPSAGA